MSRIEKMLLSLCQRVDGPLPSGSQVSAFYNQADTYWTIGELTVIAFGSRAEGWVIINGQHFYGDEAREMFELGR